MGQKNGLKEIFAVATTIFIAVLSVSCSFGERKVENNVYIKDINVGGKSEAEVEEIIKKMSDSIDVEPKDAILNEDTLEIAPEEPGRKLNVESTLKAVLNAKEGDRIEPVVEEVLPKITREDVEKRIVEIGSYSTPLLDESENRVDKFEEDAPVSAAKPYQIKLQGVKDEKVIPINSKHKEVLALAQKGLNETEIAKKLSMGKGEIQLILGVNK